MYRRISSRSRKRPTPGRPSRRGRWSSRFPSRFWRPADTGATRQLGAEEVAEEPQDVQPPPARGWGPRLEVERAPGEVLESRRPLGELLVASVLCPSQPPPRGADLAVAGAAGVPTVPAGRQAPPEGGPPGATRAQGTQTRGREARPGAPGETRTWCRDKLTPLPIGWPFHFPGTSFPHGART